MAKVLPTMSSVETRDDAWLEEHVRVYKVGTDTKRLQLLPIRGSRLTDRDRARLQVLVDMGKLEPEFVSATRFKRIVEAQAALDAYRGSKEHSGNGTREEYSWARLSTELGFYAMPELHRRTTIPDTMALVVAGLETDAALEFLVDNHYIEAVSINGARHVNTRSLYRFIRKHGKPDKHGVIYDCIEHAGRPELIDSFSFPRA